MPVLEPIDEAPHGDGWLAVIGLSDWEADRANLLDAERYLEVDARAQAQERDDQGMSDEERVIIILVQRYRQSLRQRRP